jgi:hypothetical protein
MPSYAQLSDVQSRLGRPLTADEQPQVETLLEDAEIEIKERIPDLDTKATDEDFLRKVVKVEASAVVRLIRNPDGYTSETDGDYTYQINYRLASGELTITPKEWSLLGLSSGAYAINVTPRTPFQRCAVPLDPASPEYAIWTMNSPLFWGRL